MVSSIRRKEMSSTLWPDKDHISSCKIEIDLLWVLPILKGLAGGPIPLRVTFLTVGCASGHKTILSSA
jgi:hypothetical protein